jgi:hypothetical protein
MTNHSADRNLEARLRTLLHAAAPPAAPNLTDRVLRVTATTPQRGASSLRFAMPALAAAAVVTVAVVVGLQVGRITPGPTGPVGSGHSATATPSPTSSGSALPTPDPTSSVSAFFRCENPADGYAVDVPRDWFANPGIVASDGLDDVPACRYFAPAEFEVQPNSGLPSTVAIGFQPATSIPPAGGTEITRRELTVAGKDAVVREVETGAGGFMPPGTLVYEYYITLDDGSFLWVSTDSSRDGDYADHRQVLDQMMATLEITP